MAFNYKVLGQSAPPSATLTDLYVVPANTSAIVTSLFISNQTGTATTFRISVAVGGAADTAKQYTHYNTPIAGSDSFSIDVSIALGAGDVLRCYATLTGVSFNLFGAEQT